MAVDFRQQADPRAAVVEISPARAVAQSLSILSRMLQIPVRFLQVPFEAINWGLNRFAETADSSFVQPVSAPQAEPAPAQAAVVPVQQAPLPTFADPPSVEISAPSAVEIYENDPEALRNERLKLVRWRICFLRHGDEYSFPPHEELIADDLAPGVFEAWKSAEFVQNLTDPKKAPKVPEIWSAWFPPRCRHPNGRLRRFPPGDMKYLRVFFEVIRYSNRERLHFEARQLRVLREIANKLDEPARPAVDLQSQKPRHVIKNRRG